MHSFQKNETQLVNNYFLVFNIPTHQGNANQTILRYHLTLVIIAINKSDEKCWRGCGEKAYFIRCWW